MERWRLENISENRLFKPLLAFLKDFVVLEVVKDALESLRREVALSGRALLATNLSVVEIMAGLLVVTLSVEIREDLLIIVLLESVLVGLFFFASASRAALALVGRLRRDEREVGTSDLPGFGSDDVRGGRGDEPIIMR